MRGVPAPVFFAMGLVLVCSLGATAQASPLIHDSNDVLQNYTDARDGRLYFTSSSGQVWELITDINDPEILNKGDGLFHPFSRYGVEQALFQASFDLDELPLEVFILPYPRRGALDSSASTGRMYLSPGVREYLPEHTHFTVTHELGHLVHRNFMPLESDPLWQTYREVRQITDVSVYNNTAVHKDRPVEIFAEDFRFLFGSALANYSATIENRDLPLPTQVVGLREFLMSLPGEAKSKTMLSLRVFPNPFNPLLNVSFNVTPSGAADFSTLRASGFTSESSPTQSVEASQKPRRLLLRVYDVHGRLVRTLIDGELGPGIYNAAWMGDDDNGTTVSSGVYFLRLDAGGESTTSKVILAR